jgi:hypothetical protein
MRCYFHLLSGSKSIPDEEGVDVPDLTSARGQAVILFRELCGKDPEFAQAASAWKLCATDASGAVLFSLPLEASLMCRGTPVQVRAPDCARDKVKMIEAGAEPGTRRPGHRACH